MNAGQALVQALADRGVGHVFGVLGDGNMSVVGHLADVGIAYHAARTEAGAVAMADGYARRSGGLGVCTVTYGPGLTNALTALTEATRAGSRLLLLSATTDHGPQRLDERAALAASGGHLVVAPGDETTGTTYARAIARAARGGQPVAVLVPADLPGRLPVQVPLEPASDPAVGETSPPPAERVGLAADLLARAHRPVVLAGLGAVTSGAGHGLERLADHLGAALATTLLAQGLFADHPASVGVAGGFGGAATQALLMEADVVLVVGASLDVHTTHGGRLFADTRMIRCDLRDCDEASEVWLCGDAAVAIEALDAEVQRRGPSAVARWYEPDHGPAAELVPGEGRDLPPGPGGALDVRTATHLVGDLVPADRTVVVDVGHFMSAACQYLPVRDPRRFLFASHFAAVGLGLPMAVGAAVAAPDAWTLAAVGDGGLMMALPELDTAVRERLPLVVVVANDGAYGAEIHQLRARGYDGELATYGRVAVADVARGLGARATTVAGVDDLAELSDLLTEPAGPVVVDVHVDPEVVTDVFRRERLGQLDGTTDAATTDKDAP